MVGLVLGNARPPVPLDARARDALDTVWEFLAFLLTGAVVPADRHRDQRRICLVRAVPVIVAGFVAITAGAGARGLRADRRRRARCCPGRAQLPLGYLHVMFWSGLRGAIAVALALALPLDLPSRDLLAGAVFGIVLVTLLVQGTTAGLGGPQVARALPRPTRPRSGAASRGRRSGTSARGSRRARGRSHAANGPQPRRNRASNPKRIPAEPIGRTDPRPRGGPPSALTRQRVPPRRVPA